MDEEGNFSPAPRDAIHGVATVRWARVVEGADPYGAKAQIAKMGAVASEIPPRRRGAAPPFDFATLRSE